MFTMVLIFHILGAIVMGITAVFLLLGLFVADHARIERHTRTLAWGLGFELVTGSLLAMLSPEAVSFLAFCQNIGLYLAVSGALFIVSAIRVGSTFPRYPILVPVAPSLLVAVATATSLL